MNTVLVTSHFTEDPPDERRCCIVQCENDVEMTMLGALLGKTSRRGGFTVKEISLDVGSRGFSSTYDFVGFNVLF